MLQMGEAYYSSYTPLSIKLCFTKLSISRGVFGRKEMPNPIHAIIRAKRDSTE